MKQIDIGDSVLLWKLQRGLYQDQLGISHSAHIVLEEIQAVVVEIDCALLRVQSQDGRRFHCNVHQWRATRGQHWNNCDHQHAYEYADAGWAWSWGNLGMTPCANPDGSRPKLPLAAERLVFAG